MNCHVFVVLEYGFCFFSQLFYLILELLNNGIGFVILRFMLQSNLDKTDIVGLEVDQLLVHKQLAFYKDL